MNSHAFADRLLARRISMLMLAAVSLLALIVALPAVAAAADLVWIGDDGFNNSNFNRTGNWQGNTLPSWGYGNSLKFNQNLRSGVTGLNYDWGDWRQVNDIFWDTTFPVARTLTASNGGGIGFKIRVENQSSYTQTVAMALSGGSDGATEIQLNPVFGSLIISGTIYNDNSKNYSVYGSATATVTNLTLNTALGPNAPTQANVNFYVDGGRNSAIQVNASQVWAGTTTVNSGSFTTANGVTLASTAIVVGGGTVATSSANTLADTASLTVNTGRLSIGGSDTVASLAGSGGTVALAAGATLTFGGSGTSSYAGAITGAGNLTKVGSGTFTLSAASSMTGTTTVNAGQFSLGGSNLLADTSAVAVTGGVLALGGNSDTVGSFTISGGSLTGAGTVTAANYSLGGGTVSANLGAGAINVTGNTSLNGTTNGTTFNLVSGTLGLGSAGALGSSGTISFGGGTLQYSASNTTDYSGRFSSAANQQFRIDTNGQSVTLGSTLASENGQLVKLGSGTLTLSGSNSYGGGTFVTAGRVVATTSTAFPGDVTNNAEVEFRVDAAGIGYGYGMSGSGSVIKTGTGELSLGGVNSYTGGTVVTAGRLVGDPAALQGAIVNNATVVLGSGSAGTFTSAVSGTGSVEVVGGNVTFAGASTYTGPTTVNGFARLAVNGSLGNTALTVLTGGTLGGTGTLGGNVLIQGLHAPGNSPGSQTFNANLTYDAGAVVNWELIANTTGSAGTNYDQIAVGGNLSFAGSTTLALAFNSSGSGVVWADPFWSFNRSWMVYDLSSGAVTGISNLVLGGSLLDSLGNSLSPTGRGYFTTSVSGQDVMLNFVAVPEPSTWAMALAGLACGGWMTRGRRRSS